MGQSHHLADTGRRVREHIPLHVCSAYCGVLSECSRVREAVKGTGLSAATLSYMGLILSECERLPVRPLGMS